MQAFKPHNYDVLQVSAYFFQVALLYAVLLSSIKYVISPWFLWTNANDEQ